jgi:hypothetical protein
MTTCEITFNEKTKIGKNFLVFLQENKKHFKLKYPTKMTKEEFNAMLEEAREQYARGEYGIIDDVDKFLEEL